MNNAALWEKKENKCWIWKAVDFVSGRLLDWEIGNRTTATFRKLFQRLETGPHPALYCSDDWSSYSALIPIERLVIGKAGTYRVEGHNSNTRHWFARFRRRSKVVSKTIAAIEQALKLQAFEHLLWPPYSAI